MGRGGHRRVLGKQQGQGVAVEKGQPHHHQSGGESGQDAVAQRPLGPAGLAAPMFWATKADMECI